MTARGPVALVITFGPSRSVGFPRAVRYAKQYATEIEEVEPGRWQATFRLDAGEPSLFARAARVLQHVATWRGTDIDVDGEPESRVVVESMLWCGGGWARAQGACGFRYWSTVPDRCRACPLYDDVSALAQIQDRQLHPFAGGGLRIGIESPVDVPDHVPEDWTTEGPGDV